MSVLPFGWYVSRGRAALALWPAQACRSTWCLLQMPVGVSCFGNGCSSERML